MLEKVSLWEKFKEFLRKLGGFFTGIANVASYGEQTTEVNNALKAINKQMTEISTGLKDNTKAITNLNGEINKIKDGLQIELFGSLQALHQRLKEQHFATPEQKREAELFYTQIHNLGKDGWSELYYKEIITMPESREDYWKTLNQQQQ